MDWNPIARTERNSLSLRQLVHPGCQNTFSGTVPDMAFLPNDGEHDRPVVPGQGPGAWSLRPGPGRPHEATWMAGLRDTDMDGRSACCDPIPPLSSGGRRQAVPRRGGQRPALHDVVVRNASFRVRCWRFLTNQVPSAGRSRGWRAFARHDVVRCASGRQRTSRRKLLIMRPSCPTPTAAPARSRSPPRTPGCCGRKRTTRPARCSARWTATRRPGRASAPRPRPGPGHRSRNPSSP